METVKTSLEAAMIGRSPAFRLVAELIDRISAFDAPVLIEGETGTGKELAARAIHQRGPRRDGPFVALNCGAMPDTLVESELFGHRRGAFTDARGDQTGLVEMAHGGTLFLDEVDALSPKAQVTLLRFLQNRRYRPIGSPRERESDARVIAASNSRLESRASIGDFRLDLLYRLNLLHVHMPALRDRPGDPALLAEHFIAVASQRYARPRLALDPATIAWFDRHEWPGNIRELENLVHREFLLAQGATMSIPPPHGAAGAPGPIANYRQAKHKAIAEFEWRFLSSLMGKANGNVSIAARLSGTERRHLGRLLKKHRIPRLSTRAA